nr:hypothetical protein [Streptomyces sp. SID8354]
MAEHGVDPQRGFLPPKDPVRRLPPEFTAWEELTDVLPKLLAAGLVREEIDALGPAPSLSLLTRQDQRERAMLLLSYLGHAYVFADAHAPTARLPAQLAQPWCAAADLAGRPPVLSYASHALVNWRRFDPQGPVALGNIARLQNFLGGLDEEWFVLVHVAIEACAGPGLLAAGRAQDTAEEGDPERTAEQLVLVGDVLERMLSVLRRMPEGCDPYIYYHRVRPFLFGWTGNPALPEGVVYEGVAAHEGRPQKFRGETGAQSSVIPAFDAVLGLDFSNDPLGAHLFGLREYMPPRHRAFLNALAQRTPLRPFVAGNASVSVLVDAYNRCVTLSGAFRRQHHAYAASYIRAQQPASAANPVETGTGGTPFMTYLHQHAENTDQYLLSHQPHHSR